MFRNKLLLVILTLLMVFALVAACGNRNETTDNDDDTGSSVEAGASQAEVTTPEDVTPPEDDPPEDDPPEDDPPEDEPAEIVPIARPDGLVYSLATDAWFQGAEVGARGELDTLLSGGSPYLEEAGGPRYTIVELPEDGRGIGISDRVNGWDSIDIRTNALDWDIANNDYLLIVTGYLPNGGGIRINGADSPWTNFFTFERDDPGPFTVEFILTQDIIDGTGSEDRRNIRIEGTEVDDVLINYEIHEIVIIRHVERPDNLVWSLGTDPIVQGLSVGATGEETVLATPFLQRAGEPAFSIVEGENGNAISVRSRMNSWDSVDFNTNMVAWDFDNYTYSFTISGTVGDADSRTAIIGGADDPWSWLANAEVADGENRFEATYEISSFADVEAAGVRRWFRVVLDSPQHEPYVIEDIVLTRR